MVTTGSRSGESSRPATARRRPTKLGRAWLRVVVGLVAFGALSPAAGQETASGAALGSAELRGGKWFDGSSFSPATWWIVDGVLRSNPPAEVDEVLDLEGGWVVPPFAEAHNHNLEPASAESVASRYLERGIFYVKNPNNHPRRGMKELRAMVAAPHTLDAVFANGGLTGTGGHPVTIVERLIRNGAWTQADGDGGFLHYVDSAADFDARWPDIVAAEPDFLKTYLLYSEEYESRRDDPEVRDWKGLDPELLPEIVARAHAEGIPVSTHVETATDFRYAVAAGVDEVNHLPGFRANPSQLRYATPYRIDEASARRAGELGIVVVTTISGASEFPVTAPFRRRAESLYRENLEILVRFGVPIAIGSDRYEYSSVDEALYLDGLGVFERADLLRRFCEATALAIFPDRKIGRLADGYEASFLVLDADPLADFSAIEKIRLRVKQGFHLP